MTKPGTTHGSMEKGSMGNGTAGMSNEGMNKGRVNKDMSKDGSSSGDTMKKKGAPN